MINIVIAGSRSFNNYDLLSKVVKQVITRENITNPIIISGGARGADQLGTRFANDNGLPCCAYPAQWNTYGKSAGYRRNVEMANISHLCIAFWDGASKGTQHMINICREKGIKVYVVNYVAKKCTVYKGEITSFRGNNAFLSNMYKVDICYDGIVYPSVENAYQAAKTNDISIKYEISKMDPINAKLYGRRVEMKPNFDRVAVMTELLNIKFSDRTLGSKLKGTKGALIEGNTWHDNFWGSCTCDKCGNKGQNTLGKILMELRDTKKKILCQQCNCQGAYGAGLSGVIASKYPIVETRYREAYAKYGSDIMFGRYQIVVVEPKLAVANIFSQYYYGNSKVTGKVYTDVVKLLECIYRIATKHPGCEILIPIGIGCGLAGGNWDDVKRFIDELNLPNIKYVNTKGEK